MRFRSSHIVITLLALFCGLASSCTHRFVEKNNTSKDNFEALWQIIDEKYCLFDDKAVDWDSVYLDYSERFDTLKMVVYEDNYRLFDLMEEMLNLHLQLCLLHHSYHTQRSLCRLLHRLHRCLFHTL